MSSGLKKNLFTEKLHTLMLANTEAVIFFVWKDYIWYDQISASYFN